MAGRPKGLISRIDYDADTGCWNWEGCKDRDGYGKAYFMGRHVRAHRLVAALWLGLKLSDSRVVMHRCDNPSCFNPKHLSIGTHSENARDCVAKGRQKEIKKTHCPSGHPYDEKNTRIYKKGRRCRACDLAIHRLIRAKRENG